MAAETPDKAGLSQWYDSELATTLHDTSNKQNKVYFMWDFVGRTLSMLYKVPPNTSVKMLGTESDTWSDVVGRSVVAANLIADAKPGMLDMMVQSSGPSGANSDFGEEILGIANEMLKS